MRANKVKSIIIITAIVLFAILRFYSSYKKNNNYTDDKGFNRNIGHLVLTTHAKCRMDCRHITENEIKEILHDGSIDYSKSNLKDERGPSYALDGYTNEQQHLRIVFAPKDDKMVVVTCIDLEKDWPCNCN